MEALKHFADWISLGVIMTTLAGWLPPLAALVAILWHIFQFWNSEPVKQWRKERKERKSGPNET